MCSYMHARLTVGILPGKHKSIQPALALFVSPNLSQCQHL